MTKRIFRSICLVAFAVLLACLVIIMGVLYKYFTVSRQTQLEVQTGLAAQGVKNEGLNYFDGLKTGDYRITWVDKDGTVLYDTEADAATMENHANRPEIQRALATGYGESSRNSATLTKKQFYCAQKLPNGTAVRVSSAQYSVLGFLLLMVQPILIVIGVAVIFSLVLASRLSKQIVKPLNALNLDDPLSNEIYEELAPLLTRIERQHKEIDRQTAELRQKRDEFEAVTDSMNEGLLLLNDKGTILSINKSAARLLNADRGCEGKNILTVNRSLAMQELIKKAKSGERAEKVILLGGGEYQLDASPIISGEAVSGIALLLFDVTAKANAEKLRREFTANVSHELKTPLHSISGCAELLNSGIVKPEDAPQFIGQIYFEAQRMTRLVDDIIGLSRLDEGADDTVREKVDLMTVAKEVVIRLEPTAKEGGVMLKFHGESAVINGVPQLLTGIVYNLCDNAIKYNREGGRVDITVVNGDNIVSLIVADNGIGIPNKHQGRIFERFYRVDKSHSKEIGGTGLGLSIVKHAALVHNAKIELRSNFGEGTTITVTFPK